MAGYIKDTDVYALFQQNGTAHLHVADIDQLPRVGDSIYYVHNRDIDEIDEIDHSFFWSKDYDKVEDILIERGKKRYEERYNSAKKDLEDYKQELDMLKGLLENASDSDYVKSNRDKIERRIEVLPKRIECYEDKVRAIERSLRDHDYIYFSGYSIESVRIEDVVNQNISRFTDF